MTDLNMCRIKSDYINDYNDVIKSLWGCPPTGQPEGRFVPLTEGFILSPFI